MRKQVDFEKKFVLINFFLQKYIDNSDFSINPAFPCGCHRQACTCGANIMLASANILLLVFDKKYHALPSAKHIAHAFGVPTSRRRRISPARGSSGFLPFAGMDFSRTFGADFSAQKTRPRKRHSEPLGLLPFMRKESPKRGTMNVIPSLSRNPLSRGIVNVIPSLSRNPLSRGTFPISLADRRLFPP